MSFKGKHTMESRKKMSEAQKGKKKSAKHKAKLGQYKRTDEQKARLREVQKATCKGKTRDKNFNWKGGESTKGEYIIIHKPEHPHCFPNGYVMKHRLVMEKHLGRLLTKDEHIHHINGIKTDNRINNLIVISNSKHMRMHRLQENRKGTSYKINLRTRS